MEEGPSVRQGGPRGQNAKVKDAARSVKAPAMVPESDSEWSDGSVMEEIDPRQLQRYGEQNGIMGKASQGEHAPRYLSKSPGATKNSY